ncbi:hypothetical protein KIW84_076093 [Lathyrus oleraceus]|uniref:Mitochondrial protein n=1 Tax=Pisum sativum TaxID=3888 RepID=A0A9D4VX43_PEA|nr:hypothetical protein KIW84_076093 [Pisum sativum]
MHYTLDISLILYDVFPPTDTVGRISPTPPLSSSSSEPTDTSPSNFISSPNSTTPSDSTGLTYTLISTNSFPHGDVEFIDPIPLRQFTRIKTSPAYLQDFVGNTFHSNIHYDISKYVSYHNISPAHHAFISSITTTCDPVSFKQVNIHAHWVQEMDIDIQALMANKTWVYIPLPPGKKAIECKWVYKTKFHVDGSIE